MKIVFALICLGLLIFYRKRIQQKLDSEWKMFREHRREWLYGKWKNWGEPFLVAAVLAVLIRTFLLGPYKIPTGSMRPTLLEGDRIFVDKVSYRFHNPQRGDIIVFKYPLDKKKDFVKRLVGLPGDEVLIKEGKLIVNGQELNAAPFSKNYYYNQPDWDYGREGQKIKVPADSFFALGDNSVASSDSRKWGFVPKQNMVGKAFCIWWPPKRVKLVD